MNNFISVINKRFKLSFKEDFNESDYSLICKEICKEKLNIKILDIIGNCTCEYSFIHKSENIEDFYNKLISYLKDKNIQYSYSKNVLLIKGIKVSWYSSLRNKNDTWNIRIKFQLSSINVRESFKLLVDIMRFLEESFVTLDIELGKKFCCVCEDENISAMISGIDSLTLNTNKAGVFQYKDIEWAVENNISREYNIIISIQIDKLDFEVISNFFDCLYQVGIIQKIDDE